MCSSLSLIHPYTLRDKPKEILSSWNLEFDREPIHMDGRVLPAETIYQPGTQVCVHGNMQQLNCAGRLSEVYIVLLACRVSPKWGKGGIPPFDLFTPTPFSLSLKLIT